jgi:mono/diheme cytochrome c family protein
MAIAVLSAGLSGCLEDDMSDNSHFKPMEPKAANRALVTGTVPRGGKMVNDAIYAVTALPPTAATNFPSAMTKDDLVRGQRQYNIYCSVCHGATGAGDGMIVQRGFPRPPSFYLDRLKAAPHGHFYNVITHGYGAMYSYNDRIVEQDRWRIVGYVRALQLSEPKPGTTAAATQPAPAPPGPPQRH